MINQLLRYRTPYDVFFLDLLLLKVSGVDVIDVIKKIDIYKSTPIVVVTSNKYLIFKLKERGLKPDMVFPKSYFNEHENLAVVKLKRLFENI